MDRFYRIPSCVSKDQNSTKGIARRAAHDAIELPDLLKVKDC